MSRDFLDANSETLDKLNENEKRFCDEEISLLEMGKYLIKFVTINLREASWVHRRVLYIPFSSYKNPFAPFYSMDL